MLHGSKIIICLFFSIQIYSQSFVYSKDYFRWPVDNKPGIVANFGELRSDHWHMGLDVRTDQKVNMPVYAAADGYIAKITVQPFGYGQAIYINHPNGLTTVYGHLNKFFPGLESAVTDRTEHTAILGYRAKFYKGSISGTERTVHCLEWKYGRITGPSRSFRDPGYKDTEVHQSLFFNLPIPMKCHRYLQNWPCTIEI